MIMVDIAKIDANDLAISSARVKYALHIPPKPVAKAFYLALYFVCQSNPDSTGLKILRTL